MLRFYCMKRIILLFAAITCLGPLMGQQKMDKVTYFGHLYLESKINGKPARLAFDTGAPLTCIDSTYLADSKLSYKMIGRANMGGSGNSMETVRIIVNELTYTFAGKEHTSYISPIIQLKPILGDQADGILGIDNMDGKIIVIDYANQQMGFWDQLGDTTGYTSIPIRYENNRIFVPLRVSISDKTIEGEALIDLGSGGTVDLTSVVAKQYNLSDITPQMPYTFLHGGIGGESSGSDFRAKSASVGGFTLNNITIAFSNNTVGALAGKEYIGIVGNDFWERFDMIIDLSGRRLYLKPNALFDQPFKCSVQGFAYTDRSHTLGYWVVNCLYSNSNAEKAGLQRGDHIIAVNGRSVKEIAFDEQKNFFDQMTSIVLTVQRGTSPVEISFPFDEPKL